MKMLLTGKNGQVGFELQRALAPLGEVHAVDSTDCDLANAEALRALIRRVQPQIIINPAAYTAVDKAEDEAELAMAVNAVAPGVMGEEAARLGATVIHYSTDYVFDGNKDAPYVEADRPAPIGTYGRSKLAGETALQRRHRTPSDPAHQLGCRRPWQQLRQDHVAARRRTRRTERGQRSAWGAHLGSPARRPHRPPGSPTAANGSGAHSLSVCTTSPHRGKPTGMNTPGLCWPTPKQHGHGKLRVKADDVSPDRQLSLTLRGPGGPHNSRLDTHPFQQTFGLRLPHWQDGLRHILDQIL